MLDVVEGGRKDKGNNIYSYNWLNVRTTISGLLCSKIQDAIKPSNVWYGLQTIFGEAIVYLNESK
jgi:hypothetical protein